MTEFIQKTTAKSSTISSQSPATLVHEVSVSMSSPATRANPAPTYFGQIESLLLLVVIVYIVRDLFK